MNYLEIKGLLEGHGWCAQTKIENRVAFRKNEAKDLLIVVDCTNGDYEICYSKDYLNKHLPQLEEEETKETKKNVDDGILKKEVERVIFKLPGICCDTNSMFIITKKLLELIEILHPKGDKND